MSEKTKIQSTDEAWESGELGRDEKFAHLAQDMDEQAIDEALGLQMISIRLQKSLIENLKAIATINGLGYQPLIKQVLGRFVECEMKSILTKYAEEQAKKSKIDNGKQAVQNGRKTA